MRLRRRQGIPESRKEFSLPSDPRQSPSAPGVPGVPGVPEPSGQEVRASGSGLRSLWGSGSPEGILTAAETREAKEPLWPHCPRGPGLQASDSRLQASASEFKLQTPSFNFQLWSSNSKLQTSSFNFQLWSSKFKLQVSTLGFGLQASSFSPGFLAGLKPGLLLRSPPIPRGESTSPGVQEVPGSPGESPLSPGAPGSQGILQAEALRIPGKSLCPGVHWKFQGAPGSPGKFL